MLRYIYTLGLLALDVLRAGAADTAGGVQGVAVGTRRPPRKQGVEDARFLPPLGGRPADAQDIELVDIVLVATVDGNFHALNRTTGEALWSMSDPVRAGAGAATRPPAMTPLVRTNHVRYGEGEDDEEGAPMQEQYIIEPQSGAIYVLTSPTGGLQEFPATMPHLVEYSPFRILGENDGRVFVGEKKTSLLVIELETGKVLRTISSECPWEPEEDTVKSSLTEADLDDLEDPEYEPKQSSSTEVYIGRTDYHVMIYNERIKPRPPPQNLSFSVYGPNNQDAPFQTKYHRSPDDTYIQSLPNGQFFAIKARSREVQDARRWWGNFRSPVVAAFDLVKNPSRQQPFALLQPTPRLADFFPDVDFRPDKRPKDLPNFGSAYVGLVGDSLYAMTPEHFPLIMLFNTAQTDDLPYLTIDAPAGGERDGGERPDKGSEKDHRIDAITRRRKLDQYCRTRKMDPRCLTRIHPLSESSQSRMARLLDAGPYEHDDPEPSEEPTIPIEGSRDPLPNTNTNTTPTQVLPLINVTASAGSTLFATIESGVYSPSALASLLSLIVATVAFFLSRRRSRRPDQPTPTIPSPEVEKIVPVEAESSQSAPIEVSTANGDASPVTSKAASVKFSESPRRKGSVSQDSAEADGEQREGDESDKENGEAPPTPGRRRPIRRKRGKKKKGDKANGNVGGDEDEGGDRVEADTNIPAAGDVNLPVIIVPPTPVVAPMQSLAVSDEILGFGSHGTMVFKGSLQGRAVAVKRLLQDFVTLASREVGILQESDDHPNVIRYYYQESHGNFLYIALELCPASLADVVERPDQFRDLAIAFDPKRALRQITSGLRHLHGLKIVHRDIKPQNILVSTPKKGAGHRMLISDFGLCKKLEIDQTSFLPTMGGAMAAGTVGWRAPEILRGEVNLDEALLDEHSQSSRGSVATVSGGSNGAIRPTRLTKAVDIFALGCLFYYTLTNGGHPYGDRYEREANIIKDNKSLDGLERFGEEGAEAVDLISAMLSPEAPRRPDTTTCLLHPFFWEPGRRLMFLQDASDRFEIMCRDPRDLMLIQLETGAHGVVGNDWHARLDRFFLDNLGKFRKYDGKSVQDLMRALRNKKHHYQDLPDSVKRQVGAMPDGFLAYFTKRFPRLFLHVYGVVEDSMLRRESMFRSYFELSD